MGAGPCRVNPRQQTRAARCPKDMVTAHRPPWAAGQGPPTRLWLRAASPGMVRGVRARRWAPPPPAPTTRRRCAAWPHAPRVRARRHLARLAQLRPMRCPPPISKAIRDVERVQQSIPGPGNLTQPPVNTVSSPGSPGSQLPDVPLFRIPWEVAHGSHKHASARPPRRSMYVL